MTEAPALVLAFQLERNRVRSVIEEAWLVCELIEGHALEQRALAPLLGRSPRWLSRRLALIAVPGGAAEEAARAGTLPAYAAMEYLVPLARANAAHCGQLVRSLGRRRIAVRQLACLCAGCRAPTQQKCARVHDEFAARYRKAYPKAAETLCQDWGRLLSFSAYSQGHRPHLRTTNPVESPFAAVRLRTDASKLHKKVANTEALMWKMLMIAERKFRRLNVPELLEDVYAGKKFVDGLAGQKTHRRVAA